MSLLGIYINGLHAVGGGSKSDEWVQICGYILDRPFTRPEDTEAGSSGAAVIAGVGSGLFASFEATYGVIVKPERTLTMDPLRQKNYESRYEKYTQFWPLMKPFLTNQ